MKILYSAGNRLGAGHQLTDILANNTEHEIRTAAYAQHVTNLKHIDWTTNALHCSAPDRNELARIFGYAAISPIGSVEAEMLVDDIKEFAPDLIISDSESILGHIAGALDIPLWYCSSINLLNGIEWKKGQISSYASPLEDVRQILRRMPPAERTLIYSPFGDLEEAPKLRDGFEWVSPYHTVVEKPSSEPHILTSLSDSNRVHDLSRLVLNLDTKSMMFKSCDEPGYSSVLETCCWYFSTGHTRPVSDAVYAGKPLCIAPDVSDPETIMNAILVKQLGLGDDVGQIEYLEALAADELEKSFKGRSSMLLQPNPRNKQLHEILKET